MTPERTTPKKLFFDRIFERSYSTWRRHPVIIVPTMLGTGLAAIAQSIVTLAVIMVLSKLALENTLFDFLVTMRNQGLVTVLQAPSYFWNIAPVAVVAATALVIAVVVAGGFVYSAEYGTYSEAWQTDNASFSSVVENGSRHWKKMAWTILVSNIITWSPLVIGLVLVFISLQNVQTVQGVGAFLGAIFAFLFGLGASVVLSIFTLYSYPAVITDGLSGMGALRASFRTANHYLGTTITYGVVRVLFQLLSTLILTLAGSIGLPLASFTSVVLSLLLTPVLHSTKTMIYYYAGSAVPEMPFSLTAPIWNDVLRKLPRAAWLKVKTGLLETGRYVLGPRNLPFHALSAAGFTLGILLGNFVSDNGVKRFYYDVLNYQPGTLNPLLTQVIPPALGVDLFFHNWQVSIAASMSGIAYGFPSFETLLFNGFFLGVLTPLIPTTTMLLAVILPHGIIEIPSFILAGSVGINLGYAALRTTFSSHAESKEYLSACLRQSVYIIIGLAPLFLIAGLIEADVTPFIARMFGWA